MNGEELKKMIPGWAANVGFKKARKALLDADVGYTTATLLIKGTYRSIPTGETVDKLKEALGDYLRAS